mgnify:CR=1 FL=1
MKTNTQKGSVIPTVIAIVVLVIVGGVFIVSKKAGYITDNTPSDILQPLEIPMLTDKQISDTALSGLNIGKNGQPNTDSDFSVNKIVRGDLNEDRLDDAIVIVKHCGASCGTMLEVIVNNNGLPSRVVTNASGRAPNSTSEKSDIVNVLIHSDGKITVINQGLSGGQSTDWFRLQNNQLVYLKPIK